MSTEGVPTAEHHNQCPDRALTVEAGIFTVGFSKKKERELCGTIGDKEMGKSDINKSECGPFNAIGSITKERIVSPLNCVHVAHIHLYFTRILKKKRALTSPAITSRTWTINLLKGIII